MSGQALAEKVGYSHQSAIGNLENRATGNGGHRIGAIADALNVSVEWLVRGPDSEKVPFLSDRPYEAHHIKPLIASESDAQNVIALTRHEHDKLTTLALSIFATLNQPQKAAAVALLQQYQLVIGTQHDGQAL